MKRLLSSLILSLLIFHPLFAQDNYVPDDDIISFVHGINSSGDSFNDLDRHLSRSYKYVSVKRDYPNGSARSPRLKDIARDSRYRPVEHGSYVVAHSQGGLLAREYVRRGVPIEGLVMIGTPHKGTELAELTASEAAGMFNRWTSSVFSPWQQVLRIFDVDPHLLTVLESSYGRFSREFNTIHWTFLDALSDFYTSDHHRQLSDLREDSSFLDMLNVEPEHTFPAADKTWFLWATEDWNAPARLAQTFAWGGDAEDGWAANTMASWADFYFSMANFSYQQSNYLRQACARGNTESCFNVAPWHHAGGAFARGGDYLKKKIQEEWTSIALGETADFYQQHVPDDGVVPVTSQYPRFSGYSQNRQVRHTNHFEQRSTTEARRAMEFAFDRLEIEERN